MGDGEPLVWYADSDDPYDTLLHSGGPMVAAAALPGLLVLCFGAGRGASGAVWWLLPWALVPVAAVAAGWEFVLDRRAVVQMRLAGEELTLVRANGGTTSYPISQLRRIEVVRSVTGGTPTSSRMRLHLGDRVERTRSGPADLTDRWRHVITWAEVDLQVREKHYDG